MIKLLCIYSNRFKYFENLLAKHPNVYYYNYSEFIIIGINLKKINNSQLNENQKPFKSKYILLFKTGLISSIRGIRRFHIKFQKLRQEYQAFLCEEAALSC